MVSVLPLIPFVVIVGAAVATGLLTLFGKLKVDDMQNVITKIVLIVAITALVSLLACALCYQIRPTETFVAGVMDISGATSDGPEVDEVQKLWTDVGATEKSVCKLIGQTDNYIRSGIGPKGKDDPSLVTTAQQEARADAGGPITDCSASWPATVADVSSQTLDETMGQLDDRITRMEMTLKGFSAPVLTKAYQNTVECTTEGFALYESFVATSLVALQDRLKAVQDVIDYQEKKLIGGMEQKKKDLQAGKASDCDKQRGAKTAMAAGSQSS